VTRTPTLDHDSAAGNLAFYNAANTADKMTLDASGNLATAGQINAGMGAGGVITTGYRRWQ